MLNGELPPGCAHCHDLEKAGFPSMREKLNKRFQNYIPQFVADTTEDGSYVDVKLRYIDIRFSNLCNLKCRGCGPPLSSSWYDDYTQFHGFKPEGSKVKSISADSPGFWKVFQQLVLDAEDVYFGGGEPLITKEHFDVLRLLIAKGKTNVHLSYNTNLSTLTYGNHNLVDLWSHFKSVTLGISIDDLGARAEYFRHGTKWNVFEKNLFNLRDNYKGIRRYINCTVNLTNVYYLPEIYSYLYSEGIMTTEDFNINLLLGPEEYRIDVIPQSAKFKIKDKLEKFLPFLREKKLYKVEKDFMHAIDHMMKEDRSHLFPKFLDTTKRLDKIRNESFLETYPELAGILGLIENEKVETSQSVSLNSASNKSRFSGLDPAIAVYDHGYYFEGETSKQNLQNRTIPSLGDIQFEIIKENEWDNYLSLKSDEGKKIAVIIASGLYISDFDGFINAVIQESLELLETKWPAKAHLLHFESSHLLPYFHEQFLIVNLESWKLLGKPCLGPLFSNSKETISNIHISEKNLHGNFSPMSISSGGSYSRTAELAWGSHLIKVACEAGLGVLNLSQGLWNSIKYAYPRDENKIEKTAIDNMISSSEIKIEPVPEKIENLKLRNFNPVKYFSDSMTMDALSILTKFQSIKAVTFYSEDPSIFIDLKTELKRNIAFKSREVSTALIINNDLKLLTESLSRNDTFVIWSSNPLLQISTSIRLIARNTNYRVFKHRSSENYVFGKGLDFINGLILDGSLNNLEISRSNWIEIKS